MDQLVFRVDVNNGGAKVRGVSKIYVYKGSKKIKTFTSAATSKYTFTYKAKGVVRQKYKAKVEMIENKMMQRRVRQCLQRQIHIPLKVSTKLSDYEEDEIKFVTQSLPTVEMAHYCKGIYRTDGSRSAYPFYAYVLIRENYSISIDIRQIK